LKTRFLVVVGEEVLALEELDFRGLVVLAQLWLNQKALSALRTTCACCSSELERHTHAQLWSVCARRWEERKETTNMVEWCKTLPLFQFICKKYKYFYDLRYLNNKYLENNPVQNLDVFDFFILFAWLVEGIEMYWLLRRSRLFSISLLVSIRHFDS